MRSRGQQRFQSNIADIAQLGIESVGEMSPNALSGVVRTGAAVMRVSDRRTFEQLVHLLVERGSIDAVARGLAVQVAC